MIEEVGALCAAASVWWLLPGGRSVGNRAFQQRGIGWIGGGRRIAFWSGTRLDPTRELLSLVLAVAAGLRAGESPGVAWARELGVPPGVDGVPTEPDLLSAVTAGRSSAMPPSGSRTGSRLRRVPATQIAAVLPHIRTVRSATRIAVNLGAPLAPVLDRCASALGADRETQAECAAALAGPQQTARLLSWLPVLGLGAGTLLGANPVGVLLGGGAGTLVLVAGALCWLTGQLWIRRLVRRARDAAANLHPASDR